MIQVTELSLNMCDFGVAPMPLNVIPLPLVLADGLPAAKIMDMAPIVNLLPYGICQSPLNPVCMVTLLLTGKAIGPCIPMAVMPWMPGALTVLYAGMPALDNTSMTLCVFMGTINIDLPLAMNLFVE